jgi:uridine kinase
MTPPIFVAIAGGTASGKSCLSTLMRDRADKDELGLILLDNYYRAQDDKPAPERALTNYDHPDAFEFDLLFGHLSALCEGKPINVPIYDFSLHTRRSETIEIPHFPIVVIEGILVLHDARIRELCTLKLFVDAPPELRLDRRMARDVRERGRTPECVERQWRESVKPMHDLYCEPTRRFADRIIDGRNFSDAVADEILNLLTDPGTCRS